MSDNAGGAALNGDKLYYSNYGSSAELTDFVASASTSGSGAKVYAVKADVVGASVMHVRDVTVDSKSGDVFFVSYGGPTTAHIVRCTGEKQCKSIKSFAVTPTEQLLPSAIAFSTSLNRVFYAVADGSLTKSVIYSAQPTGDDEQVFVKQAADTGVAFPVGLAIDDENKHVYWTNDVGQDRVQRADLTDKAAANVGTLYNGTAVRPFQIAVDSKGKFLYYVDQSTAQQHSVGRLRIDKFGSHESLKNLDAATPHDIAIDVASKFVYWSEIGSSTINRGTVADLGTAPSAASHVVLSLAAVVAALFVAHGAL